MPNPGPGGPYDAGFGVAVIPKITTMAFPARLGGCQLTVVPCGPSFNHVITATAEAQAAKARIVRTTLALASIGL
jgi:hypothetical protein